MAKPIRSVFQRINSVKSSLENAEQSFMDNNGMRGELDLMLAEAELQTLRRKKDLPWSWNRQALAVCIALMLALAGFGGWCYANKSMGLAAPPSDAAITADYADASVRTAVLPGGRTREVAPRVAGRENLNGSSAQIGGNKAQAAISEQDMRRLVQSARTELSSSK